MPAARLRARAPSAVLQRLGRPKQTRVQRVPPRRTRSPIQIAFSFVSPSFSQEQGQFGTVSVSWGQFWSVGGQSWPARNPKRTQPPGQVSKANFRSPRAASHVRGGRQTPARHLSESTSR